MVKLMQVLVATPFPPPLAGCPPYFFHALITAWCDHDEQAGQRARQSATFLVVHTTWVVSVQVVTDEMWDNRSERFPEETPSTHEYYLLRSIFEEHFPSKSALDTVPKVSGITVITV